jgi:DNA polymerase-3 subunit epsilon
MGLVRPKPGELTLMSKLKHLILNRPLAVIDLETTGVDVQNDRIVEIAVLRVEPGKPTIRYRRLVDPGMPIPEAASAIHGIKDEDVEDEPLFPAVSRSLTKILDGADLAGFNIRRFDLPMLCAEYARAGLELSLVGRAVIDPLTIFFEREPRDLTAAMRFYCGREHKGAHGALADAEAALAVLDAQIEHYEDLPATIDELRATSKDVDIAGKFRKEGRKTVFTFGKYRGVALRRVAREDPSYLSWLLRQGLLDDASGLICRALERQSGEN